MLKRFGNSLIAMDILMFFVLANSGMVYFSIINGKLTTLLLMTISVLIWLNYSVITLKNFQIFMIVVGYLVVNSVLNIENSINLQSLFAYIIELAAMLLIASTVRWSIFIDRFLHVLSLLAALSLIVYYYSEVMQTVSFPFQVNQIIGDKLYIMTPYHTFGWNVPFHRNSGMFWEPGVFQTYLNIGLLFLLFRGKLYSIRNLTYLFVFVVTLVSTGSTTGYVVMFLIISYFILTRMPENKYKPLVAILALMVITGLGWRVYESPVVAMKSTSSSYIKRTADVGNSIDIIKERPLFGYGYKSGELDEIEWSNSIGDNSNGLLLNTYRLGVLYTVIFIVLLFKGINNIFVANVDVCFVFFLCLLLLASEPLQLTTFFTVFIYRWEQDYA